MTYLFSDDRTESWPVMPDTEFYIYSNTSHKKYNVIMVNPSRKISDRQLCLRECASMEEAKEALESIVVSTSGVNKCTTG